MTTPKEIKASNNGPASKTEYREIQPFGTLMAMPIGIKDNVRTQSVSVLNQLLADTMTLRDLYKKHHWQMSGPSFYQLHLLLDKHYAEQAALVDVVAERVMTLGGISVAMAADIAEATKIARPPKGREDVPTQLTRLLEAHELILLESHEAAAAAAASGDDGTNDMVNRFMQYKEKNTWMLRSFAGKK